MLTPRQRRIADLPPDAVNPLTFALARRDAAPADMVRDALEQGRAVLAFQPVMLTRDPSKVGFYEGLIRVLDESGRIIPAREFMADVEDMDLGRAIDVQALHLGLQALKETPGLRLSINMSARSIGLSRWTRLLWQYLEEDATIGERLILEITEPSAMQVPELVVSFMDEMQPQGVCFALDNFGAGHTAIRHFKDFFFDVLKIDGQFISGIADNPDNAAITRALISIAHHFDMLTVAQNVENTADAALLTEMGVDCLQGYYFSAPTISPDWRRPRGKTPG